MHEKRSIAAVGALALSAAVLTGTAGPAGAGSASTDATENRSAVTSAGARSTPAGQGAVASDSQYLVLLDKGADAKAVATKLIANGVKVTSVNSAVGVLSVDTKKAGFRKAGAKIAGVKAVAADRRIGTAPENKRKKVKIDAVERENLAAAKKGKQDKKAGKKDAAAAAASDPLDNKLWGLKMVKADKTRAINQGAKRVRVGIMDTGVQADHPDIAPNFNKKLSRNFTTDMTDVDGPCENASCKDPVGEDDNGHGTHVAGTIGAALNGFGLSGVAPKVDLVNVRAGQDSGYFFAGPTINALTYSGDAGIDAVNMSFYVDPWAYNCIGGAPEDTPEQAADQAVIIESVTRALDYAHAKGVTLLGAAGNNHEDLSKPRKDFSSPNYGAEPHPRTIDNAKCKDIPVEGPHVLGITSVGPSKRKADYSNYTTDLKSGEIELSAPGGFRRDYFGTDAYNDNENTILSSVPLVSLTDSGEVDSKGNITELGKTTGVIKRCQAKPAAGTTKCGYYAYYQGTSMATPHATGVAALAINAHGKKVGRASFGMQPNAVAKLLKRTAADRACPARGYENYAKEGRSAEYTAICVGRPAFNGFYGAGIVDALAVSRR